MARFGDASTMEIQSRVPGSVKRQIEGALSLSLEPDSIVFDRLMPDGPDPWQPADLDDD